MSFSLPHERVNRGYSIRGLARAIGTHENTIRRLERRLPVRPENAKPVADYFGVQVTDLMPLTEEETAA